MTFPNRSNENHPDIEQEKRLQARQASEFARGERSELPLFATKGPDAAVKDGFKVETEVTQQSTPPAEPDNEETEQETEETEETEETGPETEVVPEAPVQNP